MTVESETDRAVTLHLAKLFIAFSTKEAWSPEVHAGFPAYAAGFVGRPVDVLINGGDTVVTATVTADHVTEAQRRQRSGEFGFVVL